jgi:DNA-binding CsgD family transcriptional regulator
MDLLDVGPALTAWLDVMARIAAVAASGGPVRERADEVLDQLRRIFPFDAGIVSSVDPTSGEQRALASRGYSEDFTKYLVSPEWQAECIEPFGVPRTGFPVRESDLPIDPMSLRGIAAGREAGLYEGLLSALVTREGRHAGFLMLSWSEAEPPSEEACMIIGHLSQALANMVHPLQSARTLASTLGPETTAVALQGDGTVEPLSGRDPAPELIARGAPARELVEQVLGGGRQTVAFLWPRAGGGWYACRGFRCGDGVAVLAYREHDALYGLTRRELEVLTSLTGGASNGEIAAQLWVTTRTVRAHVEHILEKLEVSSRSAAVGRAVSEGLLLPHHAAGHDD